MILDNVTELNKKLVRGDKLLIAKKSKLSKNTVYSVLRRNSGTRTVVNKIIKAFNDIENEKD